MSNGELQWRLVYAIIVAGKSAKFTEGAMKRLFTDHIVEPFEFIRFWIAEGNLAQVVRDARTGNYGKITRALKELVSWMELDLRTVTPQELEQIHGIGPKTSRFFILWTRPDARYAALDVHILRWLDLQGYDVPLTTPPPKKYAEIEKIFLAEADKRNMTPAEFDAQIWDAGANKSTRFQQELFAT